MKHKPYHRPRVKIDKGHLKTKYNQHKGDFSDEPTTEEYEQRARQMLDAERAQYGELRGFQRERYGSWIIHDDENGVIAMMDKQGNFTTYYPTRPIDYEAMLAGNGGGEYIFSARFE